MRKKFAILLTFILAFAVSLAVFAGCGGCGKEVTVEISKTTLEILTGKSGSLTATASNGSEIEWSTSDESVATVEAGKVTGVKAGTATITASAVNGKGSATCAVTVKDPVVFTFKDAGGNTLTQATVDRDSTLQLSVTASDGSTVTSWTSSDDGIATVSSTGLVSGIYEGEATITVKTATATGTIKVTVSDENFTGEKYTITTEGTAGKWWYFTSDKDNRSTEINIAEYRGGTVTFDFGGNGNWTNGDILLCLKRDENAKSGWASLKGKIKSSVDGSVTIFDTRVAIQAGENDFEVYYNQAVYEEAVYFSPNNDIPGGRLIISDLVWADYELVQLQVPSFDISGNTVTVTDSVNAKGVKEYKIGLFNNADDATPAYVQTFSAEGGDIDASVIEQSGTYILKIQAVGISGFIDSAWSTLTKQYVVTTTNVSYELERTTTPSSTRWVYYEVREDSANTTEASYENGVITYKSDYLGWKFDSTQMYRNYAQFPAGATLSLVMNINTNTSGSILVSGNVVPLNVGDNRAELLITQPANGATITILFGDPNVLNAENWADYSETGIEFKISVISIEEFNPEVLATPTGAYTAAEGDNPAKIEITDNANAEDSVSKYEVGFFNGAGELVRAVAIGEDGSFSDLSVKDGTYSLKVRAVASTIAYIDSEWSEAIATGYVVANGGLSYDISFGGDGDSPNAVSDPGIWYYWNDQNWTGSSVTVNSATCAGGSVIVDYTVNSGACDFGVQLYYKNTDLTVGNDYKLTLKINVISATTVTVNGLQVALKAGDNDVTAYYKEALGIGYSFSMQVKVNAEEVANNTITLSDMEWEPYSFVTLTAPEIAIGAEGVVSITDTNAAGVASYVAGFFKSGANAPAATVTVVNGEAIDISKVESGEYTVKLMAKASGGYNDSEWSTGITYNVVNAGGVTYDLGTGFGGSDAINNPGTWGVWAGLWDWTGGASNASASGRYENGTITVNFTLEGTNNWGLQINYVNPNYAAGTTYSFDIVADQDMDIQVESGEAAPTHLTAGQKVTLTGAADNSFYIQVNVNGTKIENATLTISNVQWN